jgi:hypothetical protein
MREYLAVKLVVKYSEVERGVGGELAWLEDYGAACGQRCRHLALQASVLRQYWYCCAWRCRRCRRQYGVSIGTGAPEKQALLYQ